MSSLGFLPDITIIIVGFILLYKFRKPIAKLFARIPLSAVFLAPLISLPFIFLEETINCMDSGDGLGCRMTTWINVVLLIQVFILCLIVHKKKMTDIKWPLFWYAVIGLIWEMTLGGLSVLVLTLNPFLLFMGPYVMVSYAFLAVIPLTIVVLRNTVYSED